MSEKNLKNNQTKEKKEYLVTRKCPKCNKDLSIMYAGEGKTGIACACGFEILI